MMARLKALPDELRGGAWPSPVRAVRCPVNSGNGRDPCLQLRPGRKAPSTLEGLPRKRGGRSGLRQVSMPRIPRAARDVQWWGQWAATPKGEANP